MYAIPWITNSKPISKRPVHAVSKPSNIEPRQINCEGIEKRIHFQKAVAEASNDGTIDAMTNTLNQRGLICEMNKAWDRWVLTGASSSVLVITPTAEAQISSWINRASTQTILKQMATHLQKHIRITDIIGRFNLDKNDLSFTILLPFTRATNADLLASVFKEQSLQLRLPNVHDIDTITIPWAVGYSELQRAHTSPKAWLDAARANVFKSAGGIKANPTSASRADIKFGEMASFGDFSDFQSLYQAA